MSMGVGLLISVFMGLFYDGFGCRISGIVGALGNYHCFVFVPKGIRCYSELNFIMGINVRSFLELAPFPFVASFVFLFHAERHVYFWLYLVVSEFSFADHRIGKQFSAGKVITTPSRRLFPILVRTSDYCVYSKPMFFCPSDFLRSML